MHFFRHPVNLRQIEGEIIHKQVFNYAPDIDTSVMLFSLQDILQLKGYHLFAWNFLSQYLETTFDISLIA